ncbi:VOC family protein [Propioniciclava tarda]|uniref:VOC family protein n=1 Tax=Propioniciclava tarda TaxID=433330 RepID=A0A4Q9KIQ5_PROTD|nr:VOC family protein [Propioniciclava tarda]TBT94287.1 VOC family protein [Propioniciclava tarda]SMO73889.1 hypothetical protein SAMN06266982_11533 [Propioniciclava tarda]
MITAVHTLIYSDEPDATRAFLTDVLRWPSINVGGGWPIYATGPSELGVHPTSNEHEGVVHTSPRQHEIALVCDDITTTVAELTGRGARFTREIRDEGWGLTAPVEVPGADPILIYQARHPLAAFGVN